MLWPEYLVLLGRTNDNAQLKASGCVTLNEACTRWLATDAQGRKMSKSPGNVIDPLKVVDGITSEKLQEKLKLDSLEEKESGVTAQYTALVTTTVFLGTANTVDTPQIAKAQDKLIKAADFAAKQRTFGGSRHQVRAYKRRASRTGFAKPAAAEAITKIPKETVTQFGKPNLRDIRNQASRIEMREDVARSTERDGTKWETNEFK
ncbi:hypothetical protein F5B21DRAFT_510362 [Xylaria acuta]|nr:hypothetical protein F5B21DRAFT_510362 [Xylaria acuta]